ncbi:hypothetical protein [Methylobacillus methanolivorans]
MAMVQAYLVENPLIGELAWIISVSFKSMHGAPKGETYLLINYPEEYTFYHELSFDYQVYEELAKKLDDQYVLAQLLKLSQASVGEFINSLGSQSILAYQWSLSSIKPIEITQLFGPWSRGKLDRLNKLYEKTRSNELNEYLREIFEFPQIRVSSNKLFQ